MITNRFVRLDGFSVADLNCIIYSPIDYLASLKILAIPELNSFSSTVM